MSCRLFRRAFGVSLPVAMARNCWGADGQGVRERNEVYKALRRYVGGEYSECLDRPARDRLFGQSSIVLECVFLHEQGHVSRWAGDLRPGLSRPARQQAMSKALTGLLHSLEVQRQLHPEIRRPCMLKWSSQEAARVPVSLTYWDLEDCNRVMRFLLEESRRALILQNLIRGGLSRIFSSSSRTRIGISTSSGLIWPVVVTILLCV